MASDYRIIQVGVEYKNHSIQQATNRFRWIIRRKNRADYFHAASKSIYRATTITKEMRSLQHLHRRVGLLVVDKSTETMTLQRIKSEIKRPNILVLAVNLPRVFLIQRKLHRHL
jgi:hypothetical protein